ncbi:hypothetical protein C5167_027368 [Papaver somniferum]|nr:hypothetical protein C5167_027368 [Papaver somniferum]
MATCNFPFTIQGCLQVMAIDYSKLRFHPLTRHFRKLHNGDSQEDYEQWSYKNLGISPHLSDEDEYEIKQRTRITDSVPYWYGDPEAVLLSFNFSRESFRMIPGPCENFVLDVIGGDQGKIVCIKVEHSSDVCEMCALNDCDYSNGATNADNNEYSWSKLLTFTINHPYSGYEEIKDIEIIDAPLEGLGDVFRADVYKESLVSIDSAVPSISRSSY